MKDSQPRFEPTAHIPLRQIAFENKRLQLDAKSLQAINQSGQLIQPLDSDVQLLNQQPALPGAMDRLSQPESPLLLAEANLDVSSSSETVDNYQPVFTDEGYVIHSLNGLSVEEGSEAKETEDDEKSDGMGWKMLSAFTLGSVSVAGGGAYFLLQEEEQPASDAVTLQGQVTLGPIIENNGLMVQVSTLDDVIIGTQEVDPTGAYTIRIPKGYTILKLRVIDTSVEPDYLDESTGRLKDLDTDLYTILVIDEAGDVITANINPITTLSGRLMGLNAQGAIDGLTIEAINTANADVAKNILGDETIDLAGYNIEAIIDAGGNAMPGNEGGKVLAMISGLEEKHALSTGQAIDTLLQGFTEADAERFNVRATLSDGAVQLGDSLNEDVKIGLQDHLKTVRASVLNEPIPTENVAPEARDSTIRIREDATHRFSESDFSFFDRNLGDGLKFVTFSNFPVEGYLRYDGVDLPTGEITVNVHNLHRLTYKGRKDASGENYASINFKVSDGELFSAEHTLAFNIDAINDGPSIFVDSAFDQLIANIKSLEGVNQSDVVIANLPKEQFVAVWVQGDSLLKLQKFGFSSNGKIKLVGEETTVLDAPLAEGERILNPMIDGDSSYHLHVGWSVIDAQANLTSFVKSFNKSLNPMSDANALDASFYSQSVLVLENGSWVVSYIKSGENSHFGFNLYDSAGNLIRNEEIAPAFNFGANDIRLAEDSLGGFRVLFKTDSADLSQLGFARFYQDGLLVPDTFHLNEVSLNHQDDHFYFERESLGSILLYQEGNALISQMVNFGELANATYQFNEKFTQDISLFRAVETANDGVFAAWVTQTDLGSQIIGRYLSHDGKPLTREIIMHSVGESVDIQSLSVSELTDARIQFVWSDNHTGSETVHMSTIDTSQLQHGVKEGSVVAKVVTEDNETESVTYLLEDDANGLFALDNETGLLTVKDVAGVANSDLKSFTVKIVAEDTESVDGKLNYTIAFPEALESNGPDQQYVLSLDSGNADILENFENFTVAQLIELGLLSPIDHSVQSQAAIGSTPLSGPAFTDLPWVDVYQPYANDGFIA
ncbi:MAG: hypothetical protein OXE99_07535 [Cellvibrionales bacterium]|nr:hypothetical protein [Cellvibrionales bacterium]